jgi:NADPH-dependent 2,4-dienoyl-CoA reductase/sulfur reductase-like enzyme
MPNQKRRDFLKFLAAGSALAALPPAVHALAPPRVVVVGGGFGGATVAKYLKLWGEAGVDVTLVDPNPQHTACILSSLVVVDALPLSRIQLSFSALDSKYGVRVLQDTAVEVDPVSRSVRLAGGSTLGYDRLILSPGIDFLPVPGLDSDLLPHAWIGGPQTLLLRDQLRAIRNGGTAIVTVPKAPYRCPPGPYERACLIADYLLANKGGGKVIVLDANPTIIAEPENFREAFEETYAGTIEYYTDAGVLEVDSASGLVTTEIGVFQGDVVNLIPDQRAGDLVLDTGLATAGGNRWAPVDVLTYASEVEPDIHVIGDSCATAVQPKSGHMASSQAKVTADAILRAFAGHAPDTNITTNSACFSPTEVGRASWLTAGYRYDAAADEMVLVPESFQEAERSDSGNYKDMFDWADNIFADSYF